MEVNGIYMFFPLSKVIPMSITKKWPRIRMEINEYKKKGLLYAYRRKLNQGVCCALLNELAE